MLGDLPDGGGLYELFLKEEGLQAEALPQGKGALFDSFWSIWLVRNNQIFNDQITFFQGLWKELLFWLHFGLRSMDVILPLASVT